MTIIWILLALVIVAALVAIGMYNGLIRAKNRVDEAYSDIDVQAKRRYDLIPNLISTVKGYTAHEQGTLQQVIEARNSAMAAQKSGNLAEQQAAENTLSGTLKTIFALSENYPDLKANQNFLELQRELTDTEDKMQAARRFYNGNVRDFNTSLQTFPTKIFGGMLGFSDYKFFELDNAAERNPVQVQF
jgi:LemA protein